MPRFFNTAGPCDAERHYMLPAEARLPEVTLLVERQQCFVIHAARQTGKTTTMRAFAARLRAQGAAVVYATLEQSQGDDDVARSEARWIEIIDGDARFQLNAALHPPPAPSGVEGNRLRPWLRAWAAALHPVPLVLFLDGTDSVTGAPLGSLLRQLRAGFQERPRGFPSSVALIGLRDLRDYLSAAKDGASVNPGSPFNIKAASLTLRGFTRDEVATLYGQHTSDTGQPFDEAAIDRAFHWSQGQPFLVNALAAECMDRLVTDRSVPISAADIDEAKERLVLSRTTHLHNLAHRLREPRVASIVSAVLSGDDDVPANTDDFDYCVDLGLLDPVARPARVANPLYREVVARQLALRGQENLWLPDAPWLAADGTLDAAVLVGTFLQWWRENSDFATRNTPEGYHEATVHLCVMAFVQKVVNGGDGVTREYAAGTGRVDLCVEVAGKRTLI
ncbi:MAG: ATP-binding protein, partial [Deltaproteobacteria bacterium]|nr:ATP-binding protein [Deltaproteobacteria bacterium]